MGVAVDVVMVMKTLMRGRTILAAVALLVALLLLPACRRSRVGATASPVPTVPAVPGPKAITPGEFVTEEGVWEYESEEGPVQVTVQSRGRGIIWGLSFSQQSTSGNMSLTRGSDPWFVYLEGPRSAWIHDGKDMLVHVVLNADGSATHETARGTREFRFNATTRAPQPVLDRIPEAMRGLIPPAPAPPPPPPKPVRPSI